MERAVWKGGGQVKEVAPQLCGGWVPAGCQHGDSGSTSPSEAPDNDQQWGTGLTQHVGCCCLGLS